MNLVQAEASLVQAESNERTAERIYQERKIIPLPQFVCTYDHNLCN